jgi:hypothetical protein
MPGQDITKGSSKSPKRSPAYLTKKVPFFYPVPQPLTNLELRYSIDGKNKTLLKNISLIKNGHYKTFISKKEHATSLGGLKSLRNESMARENRRITSENAKFMGRLGQVASTIQAATLLKSSGETLKHLGHLSKYQPSKRSMKFSSPW